MMLELKVNGTVHTVDVDEDTPLLWVLREDLGLTGTKFGCGIAACGACTVHVDGQAVRSCSFPVTGAVGKVITTIEGLSPDRSHPVQQAWIKEQVPQCGYCQSGMIMAAAALLKEKPAPSDAEIERRDHQSLPLRDLRTGPPRDSSGRGERGGAMKWTVLVAALSAVSSQLRAQGRDSATARQRAGVDAFHQMSTVLLHPRCLNCHTNGDYPTQGDDRHRHLFRIVRGDHNRGATGMRCSTCHQTSNNPANDVPGAKGWELAPVSMGWEGRSPRELCRQLKDPQRNGGRDPAALASHVATDARVAWSWNPGGKRAAVNIPKDAFLAAVGRWVQNGAPCPE